MKPKKLVPMGPLSNRAPDTKHHFEKITFKKPEQGETRVCNASSSEPYTGTAWNLRPNAEAHKQFKSFGTLC